MNAVLDPIAALGRAVLGLVRQSGALAMFALEALSHLVRPPFYWRIFLSTLIETGFFSLPVVALTALF